MRWKKDSIIFLLISLLIVSSGLSFFTSSPKASRNNFGENDPPLEGKTIAIDPGHGGSDPGAYGIDGSGFPNEKDFNLDIALRVRNLLEMAGAEVIMTRSNDTSVSLDERCNIANNASSDIFVSIHMNSAVESAQGTETFYWAEDDTNYSVEGKKLAQDVQGQVTSKLNTYDRGEKGDKPYLGYHLRVLDNTNMPAILNEVCFISNQANYDMITQREKRTKASLAIYEGISDHFQKETKRGKVEQDGYPLDGSYITREVNFAKSLTNTSMLTHASWSIDGEHQGDLYNREWYFNEDVFTQPVLDTYQYSTGWHDLTITTENLWDNSETHILSYKFERSPIAEASTYGSSSAHKLADDNDSSYAANDLNEPLYIELPCNLTLETLKNHFWDGDDRYYQYKVEISSDNNTWTEVVNNTDDEYRGWVLDSISDQKARYIKITGTNNSANQWYHIFESKLFVKESKVLYGEATVEGEPYTGNVSVENLDSSDSLTTSIESGKLWIDASSLSYQSGDRFEVRYLKEGVKGNNTVTVDN